ncbi:N-methylhydantoinase B/oxoprolinase/acetone carboxylase alpha subunit [Rhodoligotrophos appendicifer]|uniref:hydantoinase B/oxoprolinase family protein n=1 Tax=Rhodoligotrophos appendicifer TaxID=987056 RepID=UPI001186F77F|nr:hydantoinase B/oxoprolinase family protein [Rhodoligotrophos appendicifer]
MEAALAIRPPVPASTLDTLDPITREVIRHKVDGIAEEMEITLIRSAFSTIVKEGLDASASIFTVTGETLAQSVANPTHLGTLMPMMKAFMRDVPLEDMKEGDIYLTNDPDYGSSHLPDFSLFAPIMAHGRLIAVAAVLTHHQDIGGMAPGSTPTNATEIFQEGIRIPLIKLAENGEVKTDILKLLRSNSRVPSLFEGDIWAQIAACEICKRRLHELAERYDSETLRLYFESLLDHSERMMTAAIAKIPEGIYENVDFMDNDGVDLDKRIKIATRVHVSNGRLTLNFDGSSPQVRGPFNCVPAGVHAAACFALKSFTDPKGEIPINGGCFRNFELELPADTVVNPGRGAAIGCRASTIKRIATCILGALRKAAPERVPADHASVELLIHFGGRNADGKTFVTSQILVGGGGAASDRDGVDAIESDTTNCMNIPTEAFEMDAPIRVNRAGLWTGSGGAGEHRGGLGLDVEYEFLADGITVTFRGERHFTPAKGQLEGGDGKMSEAYLQRPDGSRDVIKSKSVLHVGRGDRLVVKTAGGGGFGAVAKRSGALLDRDFADRKTGAPANG